MKILEDSEGMEDDLAGSWKSMAGLACGIYFARIAGTPARHPYSQHLRHRKTGPRRERVVLTNWIIWISDGWFSQEWNGDSRRHCVAEWMYARH